MKEELRDFIGEYKAKAIIDLTDFNSVREVMSYRDKLNQINDNEKNAFDEMIKLSKKADLNDRQRKIFDIYIKTETGGKYHPDIYQTSKISGTPYAAINSILKSCSKIIADEKIMQLEELYFKKIDDSESKICSICGRRKALYRFTKQSNGKKGRKSICNRCRMKRQLEKKKEVDT